MPDRPAIDPAPRETAASAAASGTGASSPSIRSTSTPVRGFRCPAGRSRRRTSTRASTRPPTFLDSRAPRALSPEFWQREPAARLFDGGGLSPRIHLIVTPEGTRWPAQDCHREQPPHRRAAPRHRRRHRRRAVHAGSDGMRVRSLAGRDFTARAGAYVLACGGLENAQLLLGLAEDRPGAPERAKRRWTRP